MTLLRPKSFSKEVLEDVLCELQLSMEELSERLGVSVAVESKEFAPLKGSVRLKLRILDAFGRPEKPYVTDFKLYANLLGLQCKDLGKVFHVNKTSYRLLGYNPNNKLQPFVVENAVTGRRRAMREVLVLKALAHDPAPDLNCQ